MNIIKAMAYIHSKSIKIFMLLIVCGALSSCSTALNDYKEVARTNTKPFDIKAYFTGPVIAWGVVQDYTNKVNRRFCVELNGTWQGNKGVLAEKFYFNDGEISYRDWLLVKQADGSYTGTAEDVIGTAIGKHQGFAFQFQYQLSLVVDGETYQVTMDDWMYQIDEYRVMNKTAITKLGINVAEVTLFFDKQTPFTTCESNSVTDTNRLNTLNTDIK